MKSLLFLSACVALLGVAGCAPRTPPTARIALDCPTQKGDLKLTSTAPDRKTCTYVTRDGDEISLRLLPVSTSYEAALEPLEQELQGEIQTDQDAAKATTAKAAENVAKASGATASEAARVAKQAADDALSHSPDAGKDRDQTGGKVTVDSGGARGDHTDISLPGIHIDGGENGATIRTLRDVRLRGEAFSREKRGFRATYILAKDNLKDGWSSVGYEAAGPKAGPVTVAVFKVRSGHRHNVAEDVKRLVRDNGGV